MTGTITLNSNLPNVASTMVITGPGSSAITISGNNQYKMFLVNAILEQVEVQIRLLMTRILFVKRHGLHKLKISVYTKLVSNLVDSCLFLSKLILCY